MILRLSRFSEGFAMMISATHEKENFLTEYGWGVRPKQYGPGRCPTIEIRVACLLTGPRLGQLVKIVRPSVLSHEMWITCAAMVVNGACLEIILDKRQQRDGL